MASTRTFGDSRYRRHGAYHLKSKAESVAKRLRKMKKLARVVPGKTRGKKVWVVYTRGSGGRSKGSGGLYGGVGRSSNFGSVKTGLG